jgi:hypothetical protein
MRLFRKIYNILFINAKTSISAPHFFLYAAMFYKVNAKVVQIGFYPTIKVDLYSNIYNALILKANLAVVPWEADGTTFLIY